MFLNKNFLRIFIIGISFGIFAAEKCQDEQLTEDQKVERAEVILTGRVQQLPYNLELFPGGSFFRCVRQVMVR